MNEIVGDLNCRIEIADASGNAAAFLSAEHEAFVAAMRLEAAQLGRQISGWKFFHWGQNEKLGLYETRIIAELAP